MALDRALRRAFPETRGPSSARARVGSLRAQLPQGEFLMTIHLEWSHLIQFVVFGFFFVLGIAASRATWKAIRERTAKPGHQGSVADKPSVFSERGPDAINGVEVTTTVKQTILPPA